MLYADTLILTGFNVSRSYDDVPPRMICRFEIGLVYLESYLIIHESLERIVEDGKRGKEAFLLLFHNVSLLVPVLWETEIPQPLPIAPSPVPPLDDPYLIVRQGHTPATIDTESEPKEAPSKTEEFEASEPSNTRITSPYSTTPSDSTTPLSLNHPLAQTSPTSTRVSYYFSTARMTVRTQLTLSLGMSARIAKGTSELVKDTKDESLDSDTKRKGLEEEGPSSEDEGPGLEKEEEAAPNVQQQAVLVMDTTVEQQRVEETLTPRPWVRATKVDPVDGTIYIDILVNVPLVRVPVQTPPSPEWSSSSLPVSPSSPAVPTLVASPETTLTTTIAVEHHDAVRASGGDKPCYHFGARGES
uniref:Uncharacterized protein n=1 Tax=Tanacetum cinerariifolium TaxID=118510 RepID=A0A6L2KVZ3_TANCI|nr:hypothetical protein [Tanacetum cinerariifolium]